MALLGFYEAAFCEWCLPELCTASILAASMTGLFAEPVAAEAFGYEFLVTTKAHQVSQFNLEL